MKLGSSFWPGSVITSNGLDKLCWLTTAVLVSRVTVPVSFLSRHQPPTDSVTFEEYLEYLDDEWEEWNGALFPSEQSADGTRSVTWVSNRIDEIVTRAGITLSDGSTPTAKHFRRFWFTAYNQALGEYLDRVDILSDDQGSDDQQIASKHYLPDWQQRDHFRHYARNYFEAATPGDEFVPPEDVFEARESEDDPQAGLDRFGPSDSDSEED